MLSQVQWKHQAQFIIGCFGDECNNVDTQGKWMAAETWVELIGVYSNLSEALYCDAVTLNQAKSRDKALALAMDCTNIGTTRQHCGIFCNTFKPKNNGTNSG